MGRPVPRAPVGDEARLVVRVSLSPPITECKLDEIGDLKTMIDTREPLFIHDVQEHYHTTSRQRPTLLQRSMKQAGFHSLLGLPVAYGDQIGTLIFFVWDRRIEHPSDEMLLVARRFADPTVNLQYRYRAGEAKMLIAGDFFGGVSSADGRCGVDCDKDGDKPDTERGVSA